MAFTLSDLSSNLNLHHHFSKRSLFFATRLPTFKPPFAHSPRILSHKIQRNFPPLVLPLPPRKISDRDSQGSLRLFQEHENKGRLSRTDFTTVNWPPIEIFLHFRNSISVESYLRLISKSPLSVYLQQLTSPSKEKVKSLYRIPQTESTDQPRELWFPLQKNRTWQN